jgi:putative copper export protein
VIFNALISFTDILSIVILTGGIVTVIYIVPRQIDETSYKLYKNINTYCSFWLLILSLENVLNLLKVTMTMSQKGFFSSFEFLPLVLFSTHFGTIWIIKFLSIILFFLILFLSKNIFKNKGFSILAVLLLITIIFGRSAVSHSADSGDFTIPEISDFIHLGAASVWGGELIIFFILIEPYIKRELADKKNQIVSVSKRLSNLATGSLILIFITAAFNAWYEIGNFNSFFISSYGRIIMLKFVCLIFLFLAGTLNHYSSIPILERIVGVETKRTSAEKLLISFLNRKKNDLFDQEINIFFRRIKLEVIFILIAIVLTALLVNKMPPR